MEIKEELESIRCLRYRAEIRRQQAEQAARMKERYRRSAAAWDRIRAELLALAEGYEARIRAAVACIDRLPEPARTVERLYWVDGLPVLRIADQLFYSERNIRRIHQTAVKQMEAEAVRKP